MPLNAQNLAEGVVHWVEFEIRAGREKLIGEAYLAVPIAQLLQASGVGEVFAETEHPILTDATARGRRPSIDFTVKSVAGNKVCIAETKWVVESRDFNREVYYDIVKLELVPPEPDLAARWLVVAGRWKNIREKLIDRALNPRDGTGRVAAFAGLLSFRTAAPREHFNVARSSRALQTEWRRVAADDVDGSIADCLSSTLVAAYPQIDPAPPDSQVVCLVWDIQRDANRQDWS